jgi:tight adherence protein B
MSIALLVFVSVLAIVLGAYYAFVLRPEDQDGRRLKRRLKESNRKRQERLALVKEAEQLSSVGLLDALLNHAARIVVPIQRLLEQADSRMSVGTFVLSCACAASIPALVVYLITRRLAAALLVGAVLGLLPYVRLRRARTKRMLKFEEQFPEAIDLIGRALRAGHTFPTGLSMVAEELEAPVGIEFRLLYDRQNFGMPMPEALRNFAERVPLLDAKFFVTAVLTQRDAGGNMAEVLDNLASVIRDRFKIKRQVRVISAHGRITGWILAGLPPALGLVFMVVSPKHMQTLFTDPIGVQMLMGAGVLQVAGTFIIRKIVNIEY